MDLPALYQKYAEYMRQWMSKYWENRPELFPQQKTAPPKRQERPTVKKTPVVTKKPVTKKPGTSSYNKGATMGTIAKKALVVGIDKYRNSAWNLQGCTMDAAVMTGILQDHFEFPSDNVRLVLDERATKIGIEMRLDWLTRGAQPGDVLVFFYAGHGSQVRDRDGDELDDRMDEILCPHDLDWDDPLTDDILNAYFKRVPEGVNLTVIFDCCHSGTATRSMYVPVSPDGTYGEPEYQKTRYITPPLDIIFRSRGMEDLPKRRLGEAVIEDRHILLSACSAQQEAKEKVIEGQTRGAFSYYFSKVLKRANWDLTHRHAHDMTLTRLRDYGFAQVPQLECPEEYMEKKLFGSFLD